MQEVTMPHTQPDIVVISIDADGCYLGRSLIENCTYEPTPDQVEVAIKHNAYLIEDVLLARPIDSELRINCGSARNCLNTNYINARGAGYFSLDGGPKKGTGSYYPFLEGLQQYFQGLGVNTTLDRFLLADMYFDRLPGETWKIAVSKAHYDYVRTYEQLLKQKDDEPANVKQIQQKIDDFRENDFRKNKFELFNSPLPHTISDDKTNLLLAQMHRAVAKNPGKKIEFRFYDDRDDILRTLRQITDTQVPTGVTFVALCYPLSTETSPKPQEKFRIEGKGKPNPFYYQKRPLEILRSLQKEIRDEKKWEVTSNDRVLVNIISEDKTIKKIEITLAMDKVLEAIQKTKNVTSKLSSETDKENEYTETLRAIKLILKGVYRSDSQSKSNNFYKKWFEFLEERFSADVTITTVDSPVQQVTKSPPNTQVKGIRQHIASHPYFHINLNETLINAILTNSQENSGNLLFCPGQNQQILLYYRVAINNNGVFTNVIRKLVLYYNHQTKLIESENLKGAASLHELVKILSDYINQPGIVFVPHPICNHATQRQMYVESPEKLSQILLSHESNLRAYEKERVEIAAIVYRSLDNMAPGQTLASKNGSIITRYKSGDRSSHFWSGRGPIVFCHNQTVLININGTEILKHAVQPGEDPFVEDELYQDCKIICQETESSKPTNRSLNV